MGKTLKLLRPYLVILKVGYDDYFKLLYRAKVLPNARLSGEHFIARKIFRATDRGHAVRRVVQWFWKQFKGEIGFAHNVLTVYDIYSEVHYCSTFSCNDPLNKYLDDVTLRRLIRESKGKLERDDRIGKAHHPPNSVRRVKRRRKYHKTLFPRISISSTGALYYRVTLIPQISSESIIIQKRKIQNVRLKARTLEEAKLEISKRGLDTLNDSNTLRKFMIAS